jgi:purine-binding chemotaxis protein CheW
MENQLSTTLNDTTQYIVIRLGNEQYGIDIKYIDNIVRMQRITRVPNVENYIKGVINLRGEVIPVVSLRIKMGLAEDEITKATRIIILRLDNGDTIGMLVDEVKEVVTLGASKIEKVAYDSKEEKTNYRFLDLTKLENNNMLDTKPLAMKGGKRQLACIMVASVIKR